MNGHCDQPDHDGIAHTVDQQRPQQAGKRDLVIFGYHPQRQTSPTRGSTRFTA